MKRINEYLSFFEAKEEPILSAEVYVINGNRNYLFDFGNDISNIDEINSLNIYAVFVSHFHLDHIGQAKNIKCEHIYTSKFTSKYIEGAEIIDNFEINDGIKIEAISFPSGHAKGSLVLNINNEILLVGDGLYASKDGYNVSLLHDSIRVLKSINTKYVIMSHTNGEMNKIENVISDLENIYSKKEKGVPYIKVNDYGN